jgi:hypothetical protein
MHATQFHAVRARLPEPSHTRLHWNQQVKWRDPRLGSCIRPPWLVGRVRSERATSPIPPAFPTSSQARGPAAARCSTRSDASIQTAPEPRLRHALILVPPAPVSGADDTIEPAIAEPPWRQQLRSALGDLPAVRRRRLRSLAPAGAAALQPATPEGAADARVEQASPSPPSLASSSETSSAKLSCASASRSRRRRISFSACMLAL